MARFDTYAMIQQLQSHGLTATQAEGVTAGYLAVLDSAEQDVATKADLATTRYELQAHLDTRFAAVDTQCAALRGDLRGLTVHVRGLTAGVILVCLLALVANAFALIALLR